MPSNSGDVPPLGRLTVAQSGRAGLCQWFALCTNPATLTMPHTPVLGSVPICERCADSPRAGSATRRRCAHHATAPVMMRLPVGRARRVAYGAAHSRMVAAELARLTTEVAELAEAAS